MLINDAQTSSTVAEVRKRHAIDIDTLAEAAKVEKWVVYIAGIGGSIAEEDAQKILATLSHLTGRHYTLTNVHIHIKRAIPQQKPAFLRKTQQRQKEILRGKIRRI